MRIMISHATALPVHVLMWSAVMRTLWIFMAGSGLSRKMGTKNEAPPGWMVPRAARSGLGLLRGRLAARALAEVVVVGHGAIHHHVLLPLHRALRELLL